MTWLAPLVAAVVAVLPLVLAGWIVGKARAIGESVTPRVAAALVASGAGLGVGVFYVLRAALGFLDLSPEAPSPSKLSGLLALLFLVVPVEEAAKALVVWPAARRGGLTSPARGMTFAALAALGFAAAKSCLLVLDRELSAIALVRVVVGLPAHAFCAALWGYGWGDRARGGRHTLSLWVGAVVLHALYDHIVFGRGPGLLVAAAPLLVAMGLVAWSAFRDVAPAESRALLPRSIPEPPSLGTMRLALRRADHPLLFRWIVLGALVNVGMVMVCLAGAVLLAHRLGIDLSLADEADVRGATPLLILGTAVLVAFPLSGYLVARASGVRGVLEPAFAAGASIAIAVGLLSLTAPLAVIFALAVAPVAFGLACAGAWFGLD